ncbi:MAG: hypothetical protein M0R77_18380 [Gammaproteobacteria bacterium]|nr:hypothetical protein [Gammaproteobacteria bacterium]
MFLRAKVIEVNNHFDISMISSIVIGTNDADGFKRWMDRNYLFITLGSFGTMVCPVANFDQYVKLLYQRSNQPNIDKIIKKWGIYDPNQKTFLEKTKGWLTFNFGSFIDV